MQNVQANKCVLVARHPSRYVIEVASGGACVRGGSRQAQHGENLNKSSKALETLSGTRALMRALYLDFQCQKCLKFSNIVFVCPMQIVFPMGFMSQ